MKRLVVIFFLVLIPFASDARTDKAERKKARQERREKRGKFDNRTPKEKAKDYRVLSVMAIVFIIIIKNSDEPH